MFGYMMEALVDLGEQALAKRGLEQAEAHQDDDGCIPAYPGATWTCATGMAQLAIAWLKLGIEPPGAEGYQVPRATAASEWGVLWKLRHRTRVRGLKACRTRPPHDRASVKLTQPLSQMVR